MELRWIFRTELAASAIIHLTLVTLIVLISEVRPFHAQPSDSVPVDIVTQYEIKEKPNTSPPLPEEPVKKEPVKAEATSSPPEQAPPQPPLPKAPKAPVPASSKQASSRPPPSPQRREASAEQVAAVPQTPSYKPPEPDVTIKYGVVLGLPGELPQIAKDAPKDKAGGAAAAEEAKLPSDVIGEFRRQLRSCAKLPDAVGPGDDVHIKLRTFMTTDGMLAIAPVLIEASASPAKGLALMQSATRALEACQPFTMLPADKYEEWKILDLTFTPRDFGAS